MKHFTLNGTIREVGNKAVIKAFRRQGLVPCNLYGKEVKGNILFTVNAKDLKGLLTSPASFIVDLVLDGKTHMAVLHELQFHPVSDECLHIDFLSVSADKPVAIDIPVAITGHAAGVQAGGKFTKHTRKLRVSGLMDNLPDELPVDITSLQLDKRITAGDLAFEGLTILSPKTTIICSVKSTRQMIAAAKAEA